MKFEECLLFTKQQKTPTDIYELLHTPVIWVNQSVSEMAKKAEVAESVFEYLLCEILDLEPRPEEIEGEDDKVRRVTCDIWSLPKAYFVCIEECGSSTAIG